MLERKLDEFKAEMLAKFEARKEQWGKNSVTSDEFEWAHWPITDVEIRYKKEIVEREAAKTQDEAMKEDVDVANMAFLDWAIRRAKFVSYPELNTGKDHPTT